MWKKQVKAGILLYAILMMAVFSLLLQFYLNRQIAQQRHSLASQRDLEAYAVAILVRDTDIVEEKGQVSFQNGRATYEKQKQTLQIVVELKTGGSYHYQFDLKEDKKEQETKNRDEISEKSRGADSKRE